MTLEMFPEPESQLQIEEHKLLKLDHSEGVLILRPTETASDSADQDIDTEMRTIALILSESQSPRVLVDLGGSTYYGSTIIGMIINFSRKVKAKHGLLALCNVSTEMRQILRVMKLESHLMMFEDEQVALGAMRN